MTGGIDLTLSHSDSELFDELRRTLEARRKRNLVRSVYFDGEAALKDFGISLPPQMRNIGAAIGLTAKGVRALTDRSQFETFVSPSESLMGVDEIAADNEFAVEFPAAKVASAVHGVSFLSVSLGDVASGEPAVQVLTHSAEDASGIWDARKRELRGFLAVRERSSSGVPTKYLMHTPEKVVVLTRLDRVWGASWKAEFIPNPLGRVTVVPLVYGMQLKRPLGVSRITPASMGYVDSALRTIVRAEVSAEFYSVPEYWLFGADVSQFVGNDRWSAVMGRVKALDVDNPEQKPDMHRFTGASPQPHVDLLRMWMNLFADDQELDVKFADASNPASADAIFAAKESLITKTDEANRGWGMRAVKAMQYGVMLRDGIDYVPDELRAMSAQHTPAAIASPGARAAAFGQLAPHIDGFGTSEVGMEFAGLSRDQIVRFQAERRRGADRSMLQMLIGGSDGVVAAGERVEGGAVGDSSAG